MADYFDTAEFIDGFLQKNHDAHTAFFRRYFRHIYLFALKFTGDAFLAKDVAQESFLKVYRNPSSIGAISGADNILAFLFVVARNECLDQNKQGKRRKKRDSTFHDLVLVDGPNMERTIMESEVMAALHEAVDQLPPQAKLVLKFIYGHGYSYQETADTMKISLNTVKSHKRAGEAKIREYMAAKNLAPTLALLAIYLYSSN